MQRLRVGNGGGKTMDKLLKSNWFVILISFIFALMLYSIVAVPKNMQNANTDARNDGTERIENVEVHAYYDDAKYVVSGIPEAVDVTLTGTPTQLFMARMEKNLEVYVDLNDLDAGTHTVPLKHRGLSDGIKVSIHPASTTVTIEERISKDFPIAIEYVNEDKLPKGYSAGQAIVTPTTVTVYGSETQLSRISKIKGSIDIDGEKETFTKSIPIKAYDSKHNEITGVSMNPNVVDVEVPIVGPHSFVPIKIIQENKLPEDVSIESIVANPETVVIYGPNKEIEKIEVVEAIVDLAKLPNKDSATLTADVVLPKGITKVEPQAVELTIKLGKKETKTIKSVPLEISGLREGFKLAFIDPKDGKLDVTMSGAKSILDRITDEEIKAYVDAAGLDKGKHNVSVKFSGPQNVSWDERKAKLEIK